MTKEEWDKLLSRFELSNLTQKSFCAQENLEYKQFVYRWNRGNYLRRKSADSSFEPIVVQAHHLLEGAENKTLLIHLSNKIRCELKLTINEAKCFIEELANAPSL